MHIITDDTTYDVGPLRDWQYGGRDAVITWALDSLWQPDDATRALYRLEMALLATFCDLSLRGIDVNDNAARQFIDDAVNALRALAAEAEAVVCAAKPWPQFSLGSAQQLKDLLYNPSSVPACPECGGTGVIITRAASTEPVLDADGTPAVYKTGPRAGQPKLRVIKQRTRRCNARHTYPGLGRRPYVDRKTRRPTAGKKQLAMLIRREQGNPGPNAALAVRVAQLRLEFEAWRKQLGFVMAPRMPNGRLGTVFAPGTSTLRAHSKQNAHGEGTNAQNPDRRLSKPKGRPPIYPVASPGYTMHSWDIARGESHLAARLSMDQAYIDAHECPYDTHTFVARLALPDMPWTGDPVADRTLAETTTHNGVQTRHLFKTVQHAATRYQGAPGMAETTGMLLDACQAAQSAFFAAFPQLRWWMTEFAKALADSKHVILGAGEPLRIEPSTRPRVTVMLGMRNVIPEVDPGIDIPYVTRVFYTDPEASDTAREAISFALQAPVALACHVGCIRAHAILDTGQFGTVGTGTCELRSHNHDAVKLQMRGDLPPPHDIICDLLSPPMFFNDRPFRFMVTKD